MKTVTSFVILLALLGAAPASAEYSVISPNGSRQTVRGAPENFTGFVFAEPLFAANDSMHSTAGHVTFAPGARSAWHTHPAGQLLIVTDGVGWVQEEGGPKRERGEAGRRDLDAAGRQALARSQRDQWNASYRHHRDG
jgi:hypothetical protein